MCGDTEVKLSVQRRNFIFLFFNMTSDAIPSVLLAVDTHSLPTVTDHMSFVLTPLP